MNGKIISFGVAAAAVAAVTMVGGHFILDAELRSYQADEAKLVGRAIAWVASQELDSEEDADEDLTQRALVAMQPKLLRLRSAAVLKRTRFLANTEQARAGERLDRDSAADKALYDLQSKLRANLRKNAAEEGGPRLPEELAELAEDQVSAWVPVRGEDGARGLVQVVIDRSPLPLAPPTILLLYALGAVAVFWAFGRGLKPAPAIILGVIMLIGLSFVSARTLAYTQAMGRGMLASVQTSVVEQLRDGGLFSLRDEPTMAAELLDALNGPAPGEGIAGLKAGPLRLGSRGPHTIPSGLVAETELYFARTHFDQAAAAATPPVTRLGLVAGGLALLIFLLGGLGYAGRALRAVIAHKSAYAYMAPAMIGMGVLVFIPMIYGVSLGFFVRQYNEFSFAGLDNYLAILSDFSLGKPTNFYFTLGVTIMWTAVNVILHVSIGLFLALMLNDPILKAKGLFRVVLILPWAIPNYITALIWKGMFHKQFGAVNSALELLGLERMSWFQDFWPAFTTNVVTNTWLGFPFMMVVSLGALQSIPTDLYEAARVDGASRWQRFSKITLPLLAPALVPAIIVGTVWTFNMFNIIYLVSGGGPNGSTDILITEAYRWAFERDRYGYAAAYSTIIFLILLVFTLVTDRYTKATKGAFD